MLGDMSRTEAFFAALKEVVTDTDVVVDIGTGTGVLALGAARAGARRVFAVESSSIADLADEMFRTNHATDRVELVRGWSTRVSLPERATVMVSETVGNQALGENIIETVLDAQRRLLAPDARLIPSRIRIFAQPCTTPERIRARHVFSKENTAAWSARYGIDFSSLRENLAKRSLLIALEVDEARGWTRLGPPALLADVDLTACEATFDRNAEARVAIAGEADAILEFFELQLSPSVTFDAHPDRVSDKCSWRFPIWMLPEPRSVAAGDTLKLSYSYRSGRGKLSVE
jgi:hypothetical protein